MEKIDRRSFLKHIGAASAGAALVATGCKSQNSGAKTGKPDSEGTMEYRTSGCGDKISLLGYGGMRFPTVGNERGAELDQEQIDHLVDYALEHGVNYFDTAPVYSGGKAEGALGKALARHPRDSYYVATKLSNFRGSHTFEEGVAMYQHSRSELQVDYIDYYLLHSLDGGEESFNKRFIDNGLLDYILAEREAGRIRNLGFSFHGSAEGFDRIMSMHEKYHWDFALIQLNYVDWNHSDECNASYLYSELEKRGIKTVVMEPLLGGRLSNVAGMLSSQMLERRPENSVASWAFRFAGSHNNIMCVLSGMTYMEHLQDNIGTFTGFEPCTEEENEFLDGIAKAILQYPLINCTMCNYCLPCEFGVDIPSIFSHYNKCVNEGLVPESSGDADYRRLRRKFLKEYDRSVPSLRQASHCIGCMECIKKCPQKINIPTQLHHIDEYVEILKQQKDF